MLCRHCKFSHLDLKELLKHYRLHHWHHVDRLLQCVFIDCVCTFKSKSALKTHLSRFHPQSKPKKTEACATVKCDICEFSEVCDETTYFKHLTGHLTDKITVSCPFMNCNFKGNIPETFHHAHHRYIFLNTFFYTNVYIFIIMRMMASIFALQLFRTRKAPVPISLDSPSMMRMAESLCPLPTALL